jgi:hypothetical protein
VSVIVGQIRLPQAQQETSDNFGREFRHRAQGPRPSVDFTHCDCLDAADDHFVAREITSRSQRRLRYVDSTWAVHRGIHRRIPLQTIFFGGARLCPLSDVPKAKKPWPPRRNFQPV